MPVCAAALLLLAGPATAQDSGFQPDPFSVKERSWTNIEDDGKTKTPNPIEIKDSSWVNAEEQAKKTPKVSLPFIDLGLPRKVEKQTVVDEPASPDPGTDPIDPFIVNHGNWKNVKNYAKDADAYVTVVNQSEIKDALKKDINEGDLATPVRPLNLAPLPSLKDRLASSTGDGEEHAENTEAPQAIEYQNIKIGPKDENWNDLSAAKKPSQSKVEIDRESAKLIRLANLPGNKTLVSSPAGSATASNTPKIKAAKPAVQERPAQPTQTAQATQAGNPGEMSDAEVRAAIEAYRKRQLEAIANDNKTLAALHAAIANLGVSKKINFVKTQGSASAASETKPSSDATAKRTN